MQFGQFDPQQMGGMGGPTGQMNQGVPNKSFMGQPPSGGGQQGGPQPMGGGGSFQDQLRQRYQDNGGSIPLESYGAMNPQMQAMQRQQRMRELQEQMDNARISGADPYRMAELNRQMSNMQQDDQQFMTQTMNQLGAQGAGSMGKDRPGGGYDRSTMQQQGYLQRLLMGLLGGGQGGPGPNR